MREVADNLKRLRKIKNYSQDQLGRKASVSNSFINQVENCRRDMSTESLCRICTALEVTPNELLSFCMTGDQREEEMYIQRFLRAIQSLEKEEIRFVVDTLEDLCTNLKKYSAASWLEWSRKNDSNIDELE